VFAPRREREKREIFHVIVRARHSVAKSIFNFSSCHDESERDRESTLRAIKVLNKYFKALSVSSHCNVLPLCKLFIFIFSISDDDSASNTERVCTTHFIAWTMNEMNKLFTSLSVAFVFRRTRPKSGGRSKEGGRTSKKKKYGSIFLLLTQKSNFELERTEKREDFASIRWGGRNLIENLNLEMNSKTRLESCCWHREICFEVYLY
jgi:hypothetical protein